MHYAIHLIIRCIGWLVDFFLNIFLLCGCQLTSKRYVCTRMCWIVLVYIYICYMDLLVWHEGVPVYLAGVKGLAMKHGKPMLGSKPNMICCWMKSHFRWCVSMTHIHAIILIALVSMTGNPNQTSGWVWVVFLYLLVNICTVSLTFHEFPKAF